jgi:hypothetical protein
MRHSLQARKVGGALLICILGSLFPQAAGAEGGEIKAVVAAIERLYEALEYERALEQVQHARRLHLSVDEDITIYLYEGILFAELGRQREAAAAFRAGLSLAALFLPKDVKLPISVSPKIAQGFEVVRQELQRGMAANAVKRETEKPPVESEPQRTSPAHLAEVAEGLKVHQEPQHSGLKQPTEELRDGELQPRVQLQERMVPLLEGTPGSAATVVSEGKSAVSRPLVAGITGGMLLAAGAVSWRLAKHEQSRLHQAAPPTPFDVRSATSRGRTYQTIGFSLMGAGIVGLGVAAGLYVLRAPDAPATLPDAPATLGVGMTATALFLHGRWP